MTLDTRATKIAVAYLLFVALVVGGAFFTFQSVIVAPALAVASSSQAVAAQPQTPARLAARQVDDEPKVDPNDPKLFDARGEFPKAMRDALAAAKRESMKAGTAVKVATPKPVQRKVRRQRPFPQGIPQEVAQGYSQGMGQVRGDPPGFGFNAYAW